MRRLLRQEDGIALLMALGLCVVFAISVVGIVQYTTSNGHASNRSASSTAARSYAEAAINEAYSMIVAANHSGAVPSSTSPNLLGCSGSSGASDCSNVSTNLICVPFTGTCPTDRSTYTPTAGTGTVYGFWTGTSPQTYSGVGAYNVSVPASTWLLVAVGYAQTASGTLDSQEITATAKVAPTSGSVAAVWNHLFITAPYVSNTCQLTFGGNNMTINVPIYSFGNLCFTGQNIVMSEVSQPIDLQVGGKLILLNGSTVGNFSTSPATPITSGVVVGGCNTTGVANATSDCSTLTKNYAVKSTDTYTQAAAPVMSSSDEAYNYSTFDPGPKHTCLAGTTPAPLADNAFDSNVATNEGATSPTVVPPDDSGSVTSGGAFELTPGSSYACISKNGTSTGYLIWNSSSTSSLTVSGITVAPRTLAVNGSIFFDSNMTVSSSATYTGLGIIEVAGTVTFNGNGTTLCAVSSCSFTTWQTGSKTSMLTIATLKTNTTAITFTNNSQKFQGSFWTDPSSSMTFAKNGCDVQGPMSIGSFDNTFNNATFEPLPTIQNMPLGAPLPPNQGALVQPLVVTG